MITFERTTDATLLKSILMSLPTIWDHISDDFAPAPKDWEPVDPAAYWYVVAKENGVPFGWFAFFPQNCITFELHTVMLLNTRARKAIGGAIEFMWGQLPELRRVVTMVPGWNDVAFRFGIRAGFRVWGRNPGSYRKQGKLCDQIWLGVTRPEGV